MGGTVAQPWLTTALSLYSTGLGAPARPTTPSQEFSVEPGDAGLVQVVATTAIV